MSSLDAKELNVIQGILNYLNQVPHENRAVHVSAEVASASGNFVGRIMTQGEDRQYHLVLEDS